MSQSFWLRPSRPRTVLAGVIAALLAAFGLAACGGNSTVSTKSNPPGNTQMVTTVGDTPMANILSAKVTISAVNAINSDGQQVSLLATPRTVELSALGGIHEPLVLKTVPEGTYTGVSITATAANVTYLDSSNQVQMATAIMAGGGSSATATYTFPTPLDANASTGMDLRLDFNLAQSFDLSGTTVTFTPTITAAGASIATDTADDLYVRAAGIVTAISSSSITLTMFDSGAAITFAINGQTNFAAGETAGSIQPGAAVWVHGQIQSGGTYLATEIEACDSGAKFGGASFNAGGSGHVIAVTNSSGQLSSFQMVTFTNFQTGEIGRTVTVNVSSTTTYYVNQRATKAGLTAFDSSQIFPGEVVTYFGTSSDNGVTVAALGVRPAAQTLRGSLATAISGTSPNLSFGLQPDALSIFEQLTHATAVTIDANASTRFGGSLASSGMTGVSVNTPLETRGFLQQNTSLLAVGYTQYALRIASPN